MCSRKFVVEGVFVAIAWKDLTDVFHNPGVMKKKEEWFQTKNPE